MKSNLIAKINNITGGDMMPLWLIIGACYLFTDNFLTSIQVIQLGVMFSIKSSIDKIETNNHDG